MTDILVPTYLTRNFTKLGLTVEELGIAMTLAGFSGDLSFNEFVIEASTHGPDDERLSTFQIQKIVQKLEKEKILKIIKFKNSYRIEWLPKAFG
ncbi:MAG TPA: hypothetical protein VNM69_06645 [Bacillus sp. (in: firmicutes)]|nr:hypothetical protein [Bacillus sp. (in: firmicutes)]